MSHLHDEKSQLMERLAATIDQEVAQSIAKRIWIINALLDAEAFDGRAQPLPKVFMWPHGHRDREDEYMHRRKNGGSKSIGELIEDFMYGWMRADTWAPSVAPDDFRDQLIRLCRKASEMMVTEPK